MAIVISHSLVSQYWVKYLLQEYHVVDQVYFYTWFLLPLVQTIMLRINKWLDMVIKLYLIFLKELICF